MLVGLTSWTSPSPTWVAEFGLSFPGPVQLDVLVHGTVVWSGELGLQLLMRHCKANTQIFHQHIPTDTLEGGDSLSLLMHVCVFKKLLHGHSCGWEW